MTLKYKKHSKTEKEVDYYSDISTHKAMKHLEVSIPNLGNVRK